MSEFILIFESLFNENQEIKDFIEQMMIHMEDDYIIEKEMWGMLNDTSVKCKSNKLAEDISSYLKANEYFKGTFMHVFIAEIAVIPNLGIQFKKLVNIPS